MLALLKMNRWTGLALILAGIAYAFNMLPDPIALLPAGSSLAAIIEAVFRLFRIIAVFLALVGLAGLHFAQAEKAGKLSVWGLVFIALGTLITLVVAVVIRFMAIPYAFYVNLAGSGCLALGYILIGLAVKKAGVYNGSQGLLLAAAPLLMVIIGSLSVNLLGFAMIALGYSLMMDRRIAQPLIDPADSQKGPKAGQLE